MKISTLAVALFIMPSAVWAEEGLPSLPVQQPPAPKPAMSARGADMDINFETLKSMFEAASEPVKAADVLKWLRGRIVYSDAPEQPKGVLLIGQSLVKPGQQPQTVINKMEYEPAGKYDAGLPAHVVGGILNAMDAMNENPSVCSEQDGKYVCVWTDGVAKETVVLRKTAAGVAGAVAYEQPGQAWLGYLFCSADVTPK